MPAPKCRLFLVTPTNGDPSHLAACLKAAVQVADIACVLISQTHDEELTAAIATFLKPPAQNAGVAVLADDALKLADKLQLDGIQVPADLERYDMARKHLGNDHIVGTNCRSNRHAAMELAEAGADYVAFTQNRSAGLPESVFTWWSELFVTPCVAIEPADIEAIAPVVREGADFICPDAAMWQSPDIAETLLTGASRTISEISS